MLCCRLEVGERTKNVPGALHKKYSTWEEALHAYRRSYNKNTIEVLPRASGAFDTPLVLDEPDADGTWKDEIA
jgi:hypothetical protein